MGKMPSKEELWKSIKKHRDLLISIISAIILTMISISFGFINAYNKLSLNSVIIEVFGTEENAMSCTNRPDVQNLYII